MRESALISSLLLGLALLPLAEGAAWAQEQGFSEAPDISVNGRFVVFESINQLVPSVTNIGFNVYVRDTLTGHTSLISRTPSGQGGSDTSWDASISGDGRFVVFDSFASDLVAGDTNHEWDVFLFDRRNNSMRRISAKAGTQSNGASRYPDISADGSTVAFQTEATNLIPRDTNRRTDIAVWTRSTGAITPASLTNTGKQANGSSSLPSVSSDGSRIAFFTEATNLGTPPGGDTLQVRDMTAGKTYRMAVRPNNDSGVFNRSGYGMELAGNGRRLAYSMTQPTSVDADWWVVTVPSRRVQYHGHSVDTFVMGLALSRDGSAYAITMGDSTVPIDGLFVHNRLGDWQNAELGGQTAMSADGLSVATQGPNRAIYLWDTATGDVTQVDVP